MSIQLFNMRLGFATNSSSSHSMIFIPKNKALKDHYEPWHFGWDFFTLASHDAKYPYLIIVLRDVLNSVNAPNEIKQAIFEQWIKPFVPDNTDGLLPNMSLEGLSYWNHYDFDAYIDHQSTITLPVDFYTDYPDADFWRDFSQFLMHKNLVVLGGNDNSENEHPDANKTQFWFPTCGLYGDWTCRKDEKYGYWTLFDRESGGKMRFAFVEDSLPVYTGYRCWDGEEYGCPPYATTPELVDMKITDRCENNCSFCYQSSTPEGEHANLYDIYRIIDVLSILKVFEIALGGGEPTAHPDFIDILRYIKKAGIVPNFTTKSFAWLMDNKKRTEVLSLIGGFAYSVSDIEEMHKLTGIVERFSIPREKAGVHIVMGTMGQSYFRQILTLAAEHGLRVTLLGFKAVGRGVNFKPIPYADWWLKEIQEANMPVNIDTSLAAQSEKQLKAAQVPEWLYHTTDGTFSAYIDAVNKKFGPSSYSGQDVMVDMSDRMDTYFYKSDINEYAKWVVDEYAKFTPKN